MWFVYVIECTKCNKQYIREMENVLHMQINQHRSVIKHGRLEESVFTHVIIITLKATGRRLTITKWKRATGSRLSNHWPKRDSTSNHRPQNWNNVGLVDRVFDRANSVHNCCSHWTLFGQLRLVT